MTHASFTPLQIAGTVVPNRIFRPAHQVLMCPGGRVSERFIAYHEARARGGSGLLILEAASVHKNTAGWPDLLTISDDGAIEGLARLRRRVAGTPAKVFIQLLHGGANSTPVDGSLAWAPSAIPGFATGVMPLPMTQWMIDEVVEAYAVAAARAAVAGLEGIEIHGGHGYLPLQFLSPAMNQRTDKYGGSLENRARFLVEVMRAIRAAVPEGFAIGARLGPELIPGMAEMKDVAGTMEILQREKLADFFNITIGTYINPDVVSSGMHEPAGYQLDHYRGLRKRLTVPLLVTGRFRTIEEADQVLREGEGDMVGMVRAQIAEPNLVRLTMEGRTEDIRPCIACNQRCIAGIVTGTDVGCAVNVAAGREETLGEDRFVPAASPRKVLVVGGGVAGMEAARVAALRGHRVTLCEATADLGGKVRFVSSRAPKMLAFGDITFWQETQLRKLGVDIRLNTYVDADDIAAEKPDAVVLATGATARMDGSQRHRPGHVVKGADKRHVLSPIDALRAPAGQLGKTAAVIDDVGHYEAVAIAEHLIDRGLRVTFVTRHASFAPLMEVTGRTAPAYRRLNKSGRFAVRTRALVERIDDGSITLFDEMLDARPEIIPADTVVLVGYAQPLDGLVPELDVLGIEVWRVGDALSPRYIEGAIRDGYLAGLGL